MFSSLAVMRLMLTNFKQQININCQNMKYNSISITDVIAKYRVIASIILLNHLCNIQPSEYEYIFAFCIRKTYFIFERTQYFSFLK